jgi:ATP-dependent Clp protease adaptor protein ClpS
MQTTTLEQPASERRHRADESRKPEKEPKFHVLLHNDDYNTFEHVIKILVSVLGVSALDAFMKAQEAHTTGQSIVFTGSLSQSELVKDKILGFAPAADSPAACEPTRLIASLQKASE